MTANFEFWGGAEGSGLFSLLATTTGSEGTTAASDGGDDREFGGIINAGVFLFRKVTDVFVIDVDVHEGAQLAVGGEEMLAHSRELLYQLLQTLSDSHAPHRHGLLLVRVGSKRSGDMDFHGSPIMQEFALLSMDLMIGGGPRCRDEVTRGAPAALVGVG